MWGLTVHSTHNRLFRRRDKSVSVRVKTVKYVIKNTHVDCFFSYFSLDVSCARPEVGQKTLKVSQEVESRDIDSRDSF